jgi:uncharacterized membrane protein
MRWIMASFYALAGIAHLTLTDKFLLIVPDCVPVPRAVVVVTGDLSVAYRTQPFKILLVGRNHTRFQ